MGSGSARARVDWSGGVRLRRPAVWKKGHCVWGIEEWAVYVDDLVIATMAFPHAVRPFYFRTGSTI
jgi:hypothetical protein